MNGKIAKNVVVAILALMGEAALAGPPFRFVEVGGERGIGAFVPEPGMGSGLAAADFNDDGFVDVFVPQAEGVADRVYRNRGNGTFVDVAPQLGVALLNASRAALWMDYNGDGRLDLLVGNDTNDAPTSLRLYRQRLNGTFDEVTVEAGLFLPPIVLFPDHFLGGMCAGDIDNDGFLDMYISQWYGPGRLLRNLGTGAFEDISVSSGIAGRSVHGHQPVMADFNSDGWVDIYVAVDFAANLLWINQRNGTFVNRAVEAGLGNAMNDMGVTLGDYDNDGDIDFYITNIAWMDQGVSKHNVLMRNDSLPGAMRFAEVSRPSGVSQGGWGWGATFIDGDNDGFLDIAATNGWMEDWPEVMSYWSHDTSCFFGNRRGQDPRFDSVARQVGFDDTFWGSSLIAFDFDRDGDLDLMQSCMDGPLRLLENRRISSPSKGHFLAIRPRMTGPNGWAIGATVHVEINDRRMMRLIGAGTSYLGQEPAEAFFGMANTTCVDRLSIDWPGEDRTTLENVAIDQIVTLVRSPDGLESPASHWRQCAAQD